jgi:hypothetical protein
MNVYMCSGIQQFLYRPYTQRKAIPYILCFQYGVFKHNVFIMFLNLNLK